MGQIEVQPLHAAIHARAETDSRSVGTVENDNEKQRQLLEDFAAVFDEEFSADLRFLFAQGLVRFCEDDAGEPHMDLTPLGVEVAEEIIRQKEN